MRVKISRPRTKATAFAQWFFPRDALVVEAMTSCPFAPHEVVLQGVVPAGSVMVEACRFPTLVRLNRKPFATLLGIAAPSLATHLALEPTSNHCHPLEPRFYQPGFDPELPPLSRKSPAHRREHPPPAAASLQIWVAWMMLLQSWLPLQGGSPAFRLPLRPSVDQLVLRVLDLLGSISRGAASAHEIEHGSQASNSKKRWSWAHNLMLERKPIALLATSEVHNFMLA